MYNKTTRKIISAKEVSIRKFNDGKCNLVYNGECIFDRFPKNLITKEDADLPYFDGTYIPENFCKGLAAKYLYSSEQKKQLFSGDGWRCVEYKCGHIRMSSDCNHRMCVLAHLGELIEVEYKKSDSYCTECNKKKDDMIEKVCNQLAIDYNCKPEDFAKDGVIFTVAKKENGRREMPFFEPRLEIITMGKRVVVNASKSIMPYIKKKFKNKSTYDIMTSKLVYGVNPYYLPDIINIEPVQNENYKFEIIDKDIQSLYKYKEFPNALQYDYDSKRPEVLAAVAFDDTQVIGIACASADSEAMWQIGVDVLPKYRGREIAVKLVNMLTLEILNNYKAIPYYTTDCANISSQKVAIKSGYIPAWSHCFKTRLPKFIVKYYRFKELFN